VDWKVGFKLFEGHGSGMTSSVRDWKIGGSNIASGL